MTTPAAAGWPALRVADWADTRDTLQLWSQIIGKVRLGLQPHVNHWWNVTLYMSGRGLTTGLMPTTGSGGLEIELDLTGHQVVLNRTDGRVRTIALEPMTTARFWSLLTEQLGALDVDVALYDRPVELVDATPFPQDTTHRSYDADAAHTFWRQLVAATRVLDVYRGEFTGKASPVHFFWGAFDLAQTRFSGRPAPQHPGGAPNCPDRVMWEAYSEQVASVGFWPGGGEEGAFYAYAYPEPEGYREWEIMPDGARFDPAYAEFLLPYAVVRGSDDPDRTVLTFLRSAYDAAASLADWPAGLTRRPASGS